MINKGSTIWFIDLGMEGGTKGPEMAVTDHHCQRRESLLALICSLKRTTRQGQVRGMAGMEGRSK